MNAKDDQKPSLHEVLRGYQRFDEWREAEEMNSLRKLTIEESLKIFFQLCDQFRPFRPDSDTRLKWKIEDLSEWIRLTNIYRQSSIKE